MQIKLVWWQFDLRLLQPFDNLRTDDRLRRVRARRIERIAAEVHAVHNRFIAFMIPDPGRIDRSATIRSGDGIILQRAGECRQILIFKI